MRRFAKARQTAPKSGMNKLEAAYGLHLEAQKQRGLIRDYRYEAVKLRLADKTFYTPDFLVIAPDDVVELHETKGYWEDDARVKIKVAAESFPWFRFRAIKREAGLWVFESFGLAEAA